MAYAYTGTGLSSSYDGPAPSADDLKDFPELDGLIRKKDASEPEQHIILAVANLIRAKRNAGSVTPENVKPKPVEATAGRLHPLELFEELAIRPKLFQTLLHEQSVGAKCISARTTGSSEVLEQLSHEKDFLILIEVASNTRTPAYVLNQLSFHASEDIRRDVGKNVSFEDLERLAKDPSPRVRAGVAQNLRADDDLLKKLAQDKEEIVRAAAVVALNSYHIMSVPFLDPSRRERLLLIQNKNTSAVVLANASNDSDPLVRKAVYLHANTPPEDRQKLMKEFPLSKS